MMRPTCEIVANNSCDCTPSVPHHVHAKMLWCCHGCLLIVDAPAAFHCVWLEEVLFLKSKPTSTSAQSWDPEQNKGKMSHGFAAEAAPGPLSHTGWFGFALQVIPSSMKGLLCLPVKNALNYLSVEVISPGETLSFPSTSLSTLMHI